MNPQELLKQTDYYTEDALLKFFFKKCQDTPNIQIGMLVPTVKQSVELYKRFKGLYVSVPFWYLKTKLSRIHIQNPTMIFDNGARIFFMNNSMNCRGRSIDQIGVYDACEWSVEDFYNFFPSLCKKDKSTVFSNIKRFS